MAALSNRRSWMLIAGAHFADILRIDGKPD